MAPSYISREGRRKSHTYSFAQSRNQGCSNSSSAVGLCNGSYLEILWIKDVTTPCSRSSISSGLYALNRSSKGSSTLISSCPLIRGPTLSRLGPIEFLARGHFLLTRCLEAVLVYYLFVGDARCRFSSDKSYKSL